MLPDQLENGISAQVDGWSRDLLHALPTVMWTRSMFSTKTEQVGFSKSSTKKETKCLHQKTNSNIYIYIYLSLSIALLPLALFHGAY